MSKMDRIIGYSSIKERLLEISDMVKHPEIYEAMGAKAVRGIMLIGAPGMGKTMMAYAFLEACGVSTFILRRNKPNDEFICEIKRVFTEAAKQEPSVILLDDLDKFAAEDRKDDELIAVQACIDEVKEKRVYVIATVNQVYRLPSSLRRAGRFDCQIEVPRPTPEDAEAVVTYYLRGKKLADGVRIQDVAKMMHEKSCAELEAVINMAAAYAAGERKDNIQMWHIVKAFLTHQHGIVGEGKGDLSQRRHVAYHEAGHVVIAELLRRGAVGIAYVYETVNGERGGIVSRCKSYYDEESEIRGALGGIGATELVYGKVDGGARDDYDLARDEIYEFASRGIYGAQYLGLEAYSGTHRISDEKRNLLENLVVYEMQRNMEWVKKMLVTHRAFLDAVASALLEKKILLYSDLEELRNLYLGGEKS